MNWQIATWSHENAHTSLGAGITLLNVGGNQTLVQTLASNQMCLVFFVFHLTQTLDIAHRVGWGSPGLVGDQGQLPKVMTPATACYLHLRIVCMVRLCLQKGED